MKTKQILIATLLIVFPLISFATDFFIATSELNVRTGAGKGYAVSFTLKKGDEVELLTKERGWYKIKYLGRVGYAHSKYLKYSATKADKNSNSPEQQVSYLLIGAYSSLALFVFYLVYKKIRSNKLLARDRQEQHNEFLDRAYRETQDTKLLESVTDSSRGTKTERDLVLKLLKYGLPSETIFHDLYLERHKNNFAQIDLVVVTEVGIIVFEVKDYSGWIFGNGNERKWTQVLAYGKQKYRFYNPIKQNSSHIEELKKQLLQFDDMPVYSVIIFYGNCVLKDIDFVPKGTFVVKSTRVMEVVKVILNNSQSVHYSNRVEVDRVLKDAVAKGAIVENQIQHRENIRDMLGTDRVFD